MNWSGWLLWGLVATLLLTTISSATQGLGLSRMNIPYMLGTMFTPNRDRARLYGFFAHLTIGWMFSLVYVLIFQSLGMAGWWRGAVLRAVHGVFVVPRLALLPPRVHPRVAGAAHGPRPPVRVE